MSFSISQSSNKVRKCATKNATFKTAVNYVTALRRHRNVRLYHNNIPRLNGTNREQSIWNLICLRGEPVKRAVYYVEGSLCDVLIDLRRVSSETYRVWLTPISKSHQFGISTSENTVLKFKFVNGNKRIARLNYVVLFDTVILSERSPIVTFKYIIGGVYYKSDESGIKRKGLLFFSFASALLRFKTSVRFESVTRFITCQVIIN